MVTKDFFEKTLFYIQEYPSGKSLKTPEKKSPAEKCIAETGN
ncbi:hypothetical protein [Methanosarcina sp. UBA5]|nr:hypothetical protein [Methanosarcina sp. UBA5]